MTSAFEYRILLPVLGISLFSFWVAKPARAADDSHIQDVELTLRIQPTDGNAGQEQHVVELRDSSGKSLRLVEAIAGNKIHFKHLKPDIYRVCLHGDSFKTCKSIDTFPSKESDGNRFTADIAGPSLAFKSVSRHTVSLEQLQIPEKARQELQHSLDAAVRGDFHEEITHLQRAIEIYPTYVDALNNLGFCYHVTGNQALSVRYLTQATELDPEFHTAWANLSGALWSLGKRDEALKAALHGLSLRPDSASSNSQIAFWYYRVQRYPEAEKYFKKVLDLDPAAATFPMLYLAQIALMDNRKEDAEAWVRIFVKLHANHPEAAYWAGKLQDIESGKVDRESTMASHPQRQPPQAQ